MADSELAEITQVLREGFGLNIPKDVQSAEQLVLVLNALAPTKGEEMTDDEGEGQTVEMSTLLPDGTRAPRTAREVRQRQAQLAEKLSGK